MRPSHANALTPGDSGYLLAIERSTAIGSVAIHRNGHVLHMEKAPAGPLADRDVCAAVDRALSSAGLTPRDITRFGLGLGPGSFSGIRAALGYLHGLAAPSGARVEGTSSSAALALAGFRVRPQLQRLAVVGDARRQTLWVAVFARTGTTLRAETQLGLVAPADLRTSLPGDIPILSPDWERLENSLKGVLERERWMREPCVPDAGAVAELLADPDAPRISPALPVYLHPAVAGANAGLG